MDAIRTTPTKTWLKKLNLSHLNAVFEAHGFNTVASVLAMSSGDLDTIFTPDQLKLGERRLLEQQIESMKKVRKHRLLL